MTQRAFWVNGIFFFAIIISMIAIRQFMRGNDQELGSNDYSPDAYMKNASYVRTNEQGQEDILLYSPLVTHYHYRNTSTLQKPIIKIIKNRQQWFITSEKAKSINGIEKFCLQSHVVVRQLPTKDKASTSLFTPSLTVFPQKNVVSTEDFVTIKQSGLEITGKGLQADLDQGNIKLLSQTRGQYHPSYSR